MEQARRGELVREQAEVPEWVDHEGEERVAPEPVQVQLENGCVQNADTTVARETGTPCYFVTRVLKGNGCFMLIQLKPPEGCKR
jgi:hypothetical protein